MTLKLIDLYNAAASQEWSMYDNVTTSTEDFENSLIIDLNKAVLEIMYSHPFPFRERTHIILTVPNINSYELPSGLIMKTGSDYNIKINSKPLKMIDKSLASDNKKGIPEYFYIKGNSIVFYPTPVERSIVTIDYITLAIGENTDGEEIFALKNDDDTISVPVYLEEIFKNAVISRAMLNSISAEGDENYSAYKKQSETFYRQLVKYSNGIGLDKSVKI